MMVCRAVTSASRHKLSLVDLHGHRPHDQIERKDEARPVLPAQDDALHPPQGAAPDSGTTPGLQVRMGLHLTAMVDTVLNDPDVLFGQGGWTTAKTDQVSDA